MPLFIFFIYIHALLLIMFENSGIYIHTHIKRPTYKIGPQFENVANCQNALALLTLTRGKNTCILGDVMSNLTVRYTSLHWKQMMRRLGRRVGHTYTQT